MCGGRLLRSCQLGLQIGELGIAQLEHALGFVELAFEVAYAALQLRNFRGIVGTGARAGGRLAGRNQAQTTCSAGARRRRIRADTATDFVARFRRRYRCDFVAARDAQYGAGSQPVHVAFERAGIATVDRHHELIRALPAAGGQAARDRGEAVATLHFVTVATAGGRLRHGAGGGLFRRGA